MNIIPHNLCIYPEINMYTHKSILIERNFIIQYRSNGQIIKVEKTVFKIFILYFVHPNKTAGEEIILAKEQSSV